MRRRRGTLRHFVRALAREVIAQKHVLLGGCRTELDHVAAEARRARG
jgi:hypothetical protein